MPKKIRLSEIQQFAMRAADERFLLAQNKRRKLGVAVGEELGISEKELSQWRFAEDFSFIELPEKIEPEKEEEKKG